MRLAAPRLHGLQRLVLRSATVPMLEGYATGEFPCSATASRHPERSKDDRLLDVEGKKEGDRLFDNGALLCLHVIASPMLRWADPCDLVDFIKPT
jgi:hypothetical protein